MLNLRKELAKFAGKAAVIFMQKILKRGATSLPGLVALKIDSHILESLARDYCSQTLVVSGTNGKTTTCGLINAILKCSHKPVIRNKEGSNLLRGITSTLLKSLANKHGNSIGLFELDEAAFPKVVKALQPQIILLTNLFRDQLDRYGEVDTVARLWKESISELSENTILILNADDPAICSLGVSAKCKVVYFGIDYQAMQKLPDDSYQVIDSRTCQFCQSELAYTSRYYSHLGIYTCTNCSFERHDTEISAIKVEVNEAGSQSLILRQKNDIKQIQCNSQLQGSFNTYNILAAVSAGIALNCPMDAICSGVEHFLPAFGRGEKVDINGKEISIFLAKNPTGLNEVLRTISTTNDRLKLLLILNDNYADGRDISWIWDANFEYLHKKIENIVISGTRALDLAVRLKYANCLDSTNQEKGHPYFEIRENIAEALELSLTNMKPGDTLFVVPTYTAMLELRNYLEKFQIVSPYWEDNKESISV